MIVQGKQTYKSHSKNGDYTTHRVFIADVHGRSVLEREYNSIHILRPQGYSGCVVVAKNSEGYARVLKWNNARRKFEEVAYPGGFGDDIAALELKVKKEEDSLNIQKRAASRKPAKDATEAQMIEHRVMVNSARETIVDIENGISKLKWQITKKRLLRNRTWRNEVVDIAVGAPDRWYVGYVEGDKEPKLLGRSPYDRQEELGEYGVLCSIKDALSPVDFAQNLVLESV